MTDERPPALHDYCAMPHGNPSCVRTWHHSGDCLPGCRICNTTAHLTANCPTWSDYPDAPLIPPVLPPYTPPTPAP